MRQTQPAADAPPRSFLLHRIAESLRTATSHSLVDVKTSLEHEGAQARKLLLIVHQSDRTLYKFPATTNVTQEFAVFVPILIRGHEATEHAQGRWLKAVLVVLIISFCQAAEFQFLQCLFTTEIWRLHMHDKLAILSNLQVRAVITAMPSCSETNGSTRATYCLCYFSSART
jgi:hypothetical protein